VLGLCSASIDHRLALPDPQDREGQNRLERKETGSQLIFGESSFFYPRYNRFTPLQGAGEKKKEGREAKEGKRGGAFGQCSTSQTRRGLSGLVGLLGRHLVGSEV